MVISLDRSDYYTQVANSGAPRAIQAADRFHLLCNLRGALSRLAGAHVGEMVAAAKAVAKQKAEACGHLHLQANDQLSENTEKPGLREQLKQQGRARRLERYKQLIVG